jgi:LPS export ABC transporter protein LptC
MESPVFIRPVLLAILATTAIIGIVSVKSRNGSHSLQPARSALQQLPRNIDIALQKARFSEMHDGSVVWELDAERVEYDKSGEMANLKVIRMNFHRSKAAGTVTVTADSGEYHAASNNVRLRGNVRVQTGEGASFDTTDLEYDAVRSQLSTTDPVIFRQQRLTLQAVGMVMGIDDQCARFSSLIEATVAGAGVTQQKQTTIIR